jgi:hypothetical protein
MHLVDDGFERMRRLIDVDDIITELGAGCPRRADRPRGVATASQCNEFLLYEHQLRNGDDDADRRRGGFSFL